MTFSFSLSLFLITSYFLLPSNHHFCTSPFSSLAIHNSPLLSYKDPQWISALISFFTPHMVLRHSTQKYSPLYYLNEHACGESQCADQCANLSPAAHVKHCVMGRLHSTLQPCSWFYFLPTSVVKKNKKINQCTSFDGKNLSVLPSW